jgi:predicted membrane protein
MQAKQMAIGLYKQGLSTNRGMVEAMAPKLLLTGRFEPSAFAAKVKTACVFVCMCVLWCVCACVLCAVGVGVVVVCTVCASVLKMAATVCAQNGSYCVARKVAPELLLTGRFEPSASAIKVTTVCVVVWE